MNDISNRSIFSKDMDKSIVSPFFDSRCTHNQSYGLHAREPLISLMRGRGPAYTVTSAEVELGQKVG